MISWLNIKSSWRAVADAARTTINKEKGVKEPADWWKKQILLAEHSPIRKLVVSWKWVNIKSWVSVHFVRHKIGIEHWVTTQRTDRTGVNRDNLPQAQLVSHEAEANAQAIINISRKRLCQQAAPETKQAWLDMLEELKKKEPILYEVCVPECVYRGLCPEFNSCGYVNTEKYKERLENYRKIVRKE